MTTKFKEKIFKFKSVVLGVAEWRATKRDKTAQLKKSRSVMF